MYHFWILGLTVGKLKSSDTQMVTVEFSATAVNEFLVKYLFSVVHEDRCLTIAGKENTLSSTFDGNVSAARVIITLLTI